MEHSARSQWEVVKEFSGENNIVVVVKRLVIRGKYTRYSLSIGTRQEKGAERFVAPFVQVRTEGLVDVQITRVGLTVGNLVAEAEDWIKEDANTWAKSLQDDMYLRDSARAERTNVKRTRHTGKTERTREKKLAKKSTSATA